MTSLTARRAAGKGDRPEFDTIVALLYRRVSSREQAEEGVSLDAQLQESRRYAHRWGWLLGDEFEDVESGRHPSRREYQRMLNVLRGHRLAGRQVVLIVAALDRLGRNLAERVRVWNELLDLEVPIHSIREGGQVGRLSYNILASVAEEESHKLGERIKASQTYFISRGWWPIGRVAWGYQLRPATAEERALGAPAKVPEPHPLEAPYLQEAFRRRADGDSIETLVYWIRALPGAARGDRRVAFSSIRATLRSPVYIARNHTGDGDPIDRPPGHWPALVDEATWRRVRARDQASTPLALQASGRYALTGLLRCHRCGSRMAGSSHLQRQTRISGEVVAYPRRKYLCSGIASGSTARCSTYIATHSVETPTLDVVVELLDTLDQPSLTQLIREEWEAQERVRLAPIGPDQRPKLQRIAERSRARMSAATVRLLDGDISKAVYDQILPELQTELEAAQAELARLEQRTAPPPPLPLEAVLSGVHGWAEHLRSGSPAAVREALSVLLEQITPVWIGRGRYEVQLRWTPVGLALLQVAVKYGQSQELSCVQRFGRTNRWTHCNNPPTEHVS